MEHRNKEELGLHPSYGYRCDFISVFVKPPRVIYLYLLLVDLFRDLRGLVSVVLL